MHRFPFASTSKLLVEDAAVIVARRAVSVALRSRPTITAARAAPGWLTAPSPLCRAFTTTPPRRDAADDDDAEDQSLRSSYVKALTASGPDAWPKDAFEISFARSSGPGGQNVNKVNTKAQLRYSLFPSRNSHPHPPPRLIPRLQTSRYYVASTSSLLISSQSTRSASSNAADVVERFHEHLIELFSEGLRGETSDEARRRVRELEMRDKKRNEVSKKKRGEIKSGRRAGRNARDWM